MMRVLSRNRIGAVHAAARMNAWAKLVRTLDHEGATEDGTITPFQARLVVVCFDPPQLKAGIADILSPVLKDLPWEQVAKDFDL